MLPEFGTTNSDFRRSAFPTLLNTAAKGTGTGNAGVSSSVLPPYPTTDRSSGIAAGTGFLVTPTNPISLSGVTEGASSDSTLASNSPVPVSGSWSLTATEPTVALPFYDPPSSTIAGAAVTSEAVHLSGYVINVEITLACVRIDVLTVKLSIGYFLQSMRIETISRNPNSSNSTSITSKRSSRRPTLYSTP